MLVKLTEENKKVVGHLIQTVCAMTLSIAIIWAGVWIKETLQRIDRATVAGPAPITSPAACPDISSATEQSRMSGRDSVITGLHKYFTEQAIKPVEERRFEICIDLEKKQCVVITKFEIK